MYNKIITKSIKPEEQVDKEALDLLRVQHLLHLYFTNLCGEVVFSFINILTLPAVILCICLCSHVTINTVFYVMYIVPSYIKSTVVM